MYQFTTNTIINSLVDASNPSVAKFESVTLADGTLAFKVSKVGTFKKANIVRISKKAYNAGVKEQAQITVTAVASGTVIRLELDIRLSQQTHSEYANTYLYFKKPVVVEILATNNATNDAASLVSQLNKLHDRFGHSYVTATSSGAVITLVAKDDNQRFHSVKLYKQSLSPNSIIEPEYTVEATGSVTTAGKLGFGDDDWMLRHVTLQTAENVRYFGISKDERPILGGNYSQYVLNYSTDKEQDGIVAGAKSITNHVFWVPASLVSDFEGELDDLSLPIGISVSAASTSLANSATTQMTATNYVGTVTWSVTSGTSATVNASTGVVTAHGSIDGNTVIRGTDSLGNYDEVTIAVA